MAAPLDLLQGNLDLLVLRTLTQGPMHGYTVARWIKERSDNVLLVEEGALYPALHRLERKGFVESEWGVSENNRKAKFYQLTTARPRTAQDRARRVGPIHAGRGRRASTRVTIANVQLT